MFKKIGMAVAIAAASTSASAAWNATGADSELILNVWNETAGEEASLSLDLGLFTKDGPLGNENLSFSVDTAAIADIAGTADLSSLKWNVAGVDNRTPANPADVDAFGLYVTAVNQPALGAQYSYANAGNVGSEALGQLDFYLQGPNSGNTTVIGGTAADPLFKTVTAGSYAGNNNVFGENAFTLQGQAWMATKTAATSGESLYAYKMGMKIDGGLANDFQASAGVWTFDATSGSLTYAAPVPLPAAVWMFASGLLGMAGVARRKKA